jgi:uroporphyrin-3 C-methyltransferase
MTEQLEAPQKSTIHWKKVGIFFTLLGIFIFVSGFGYGYFSLFNYAISLEQKITTLQTHLHQATSDLTALQTSIATLSQAEQKSQALNEQQQKIITDWQTTQKSNSNPWQIAEANYLVKLAGPHLQVTHDVTATLALLQNADNLLQNLQDPATVDIREALTKDIVALQASPKVNVTSLYLQLVALNSQLEKLPLPINPLSANAATTVSPASSAESWWETGLAHSWQALSKVVIVRRNDATTLPLVLPEEKRMLYQNLHLQLQSAMWALLQRNDVIYKACLQQAINWIQAYFAQETPETKSMLQNLQTLQKTDIQPVTINMAATLQLFDVYFANLEKTSSSR